jgi:hypothetical protein
VPSPRKPGHTKIGYAPPHEPVFTDEQTQHDLRAPTHEEDGPDRERPPIEVQVEMHKGPMRQSAKWRAIEIWTKNRVYSVDSTGVCIEVLDRATGRPDEDHALLGARLAGGQRKEGQRLKLSHPYPVPGTEAVFRLPAGRAGRFGQTSKVERVVLRVRVADMPLLESEPVWDELSSGSSVPPPKSGMGSATGRSDDGRSGR